VVFYDSFMKIKEVEHILGSRYFFHGTCCVVILKKWSVLNFGRISHTHLVTLGASVHIVAGKNRHPCRVTRWKIAQDIAQPIIVKINTEPNLFFVKINTTTNLFLSKLIRSPTYFCQNLYVTFTMEKIVPKTFSRCCNFQKNCTELAITQ
jgi:hypothetical protein